MFTVYHGSSIKTFDCFVKHPVLHLLWDFYEIIAPVKNFKAAGMKLINFYKKEKKNQFSKFKEMLFYVYKIHSFASAKVFLFYYSFLNNIYRKICIWRHYCLIRHKARCTVVFQEAYRQCNDSHTFICLFRVALCFNGVIFPSFLWVIFYLVSNFLWVILLK